MNRPGASVERGALRQLLPANADLWTIGLLLAGLLGLYVPTYMDLATTIWATDEQGHGPIILAVSIWLIWRKRDELASLAKDPKPTLGWSLVFLALLLYAFGRTQAILLFEVGSQILILIGLILVMLGKAGLKLLWFPLFFMLFMIPLPGVLVVAVTGPLKSAVSTVAEFVLYQAGYPVARSGVILSVGPYQLLVADACAGLNSMFTLEALGLLYMNLMNYTAPARNLALAILIIPISFVANVIRVMILVLVTFHFGDEAGQGFVHGFAGMVLFMAGLVMMLATDKLLGLWLPAHARPEEAKA